MLSWLGRVTYSLGLLLALLCLVGRADAEETDVSGGIESYREFTLQNGLRVVIAVDHRVPQVALHIAYAVGEALDPPDQRGLAQLIGAMLPKLDTRHLHAAERGSLLAAAGFAFEEPRVTVGFDITAEALQVPAEALELGLWLEADRMAYAADGVTETRLAEAWPSARDSVDRAPDDPGAALAFRAALGRTHPYGALDRAADLSKTKATFVAARLRRYYNPASAVLVLVGDVDPAGAEQAVRRSFGPLTSAALAPLPTVARSAKSRSVSMSAPISAPYSAQVWETPRYFAPDDKGLDVVATVLSRRLVARDLCNRLSVAQRSRRLTSVFVASCAGPKTSADAWRAALHEELHALAEGRVPNNEVEGAALHYAVNMAERFDDLQGRAEIIASAVINGHGAQAVPDTLKGYAGTDAAQVAAIVQRHLLRPADATIEIARSDKLPRDGTSYFSHDSEPMFQVPAETITALPALTTDWPRPPANGAPHHFHPMSGPSDTLANGDHFRFVERFGLGDAHVNLLIPWPAAAINPAARPALGEWLLRAPVAGIPLRQRLQLLGAELYCYGRFDEFELLLVAPSRTLPAALDALRSVLALKELPPSEFEAVRATLDSWARRSEDPWDWYWDVLALSAPGSRYQFLTSPDLKQAVAQLKPADVANVWAKMAHLPREIGLVGPLDVATARALGGVLSRPETTVARRPVATRALFRPGVYLFDRPQSKAGGSAGNEKATEYVEGCVMWPVPRWGTPRHSPAHLVSFLFGDEMIDGLSARLAEHGMTTPRWQSNTVLNIDGDFLRFSFQVPIGQLGTLLESVKAHLARLGEGQFAQTDFVRTVAALRGYDFRESLSGQGLLNAIFWAASHDAATDDALDIPLQVERTPRHAISDWVKGLTFQGAVIGIIGPAGEVTESLKPLGLKPSTVAKAAASEGSKAP